jgi:hypothetical protein
MHKPFSTDRPVAEAILESGEVTIDVLMQGDALAEIPFIGTAIKICKAIDNIRDRAFAAKIALFVTNLHSITDEQKNRLKVKMSANNEESTKVGETLFFVLEQITDLDKPALLAKVFLAYVDGIASAEELRRLCHAVNVTFGDDLHKFLAVSEPREIITLMALVHSGLTQIYSDNGFNGSGVMYRITPLGMKLREIYCFE